MWPVLPGRSTGALRRMRCQAAAKREAPQSADMLGLLGRFYDDAGRCAILLRFMSPEKSPGLSP
jgi:hypothetical protein